ncbi:MAG: Tol-Pal system beta propeller repeat protein TolB [Gammaproteobacteria bacterium]|nr:Tol-Pal system beta propeller repeat protein TolB [Gammaproteobacteria bacterium]
MISFFRILSLGLCGSSSLAFAADTLDTIIIDAGVDNPVRIAVVPFRQRSELDGLPRMADIIGFDLARSGQFAPLDEENMLSYPTEEKEVFFRDWRILGVEYLVIGRANLEFNGDVSVSYHLYDVANERQMLNDRLTAVRGKWRDIAHHISDAVFEKTTGIRGAFATKIIYVLARDAGAPSATFSLEIADSDGERARTLFSSREPILSASWSPDGRTVAYVSFETGRPGIVLQDIVSGSRELLPQFKGINSAPVFSPDGNSLAMVLSRDGNPEIYVMNLKDRRLRRITRHHAIDTEPSWTPDGQNLVFTSERGGRPQIYLLELKTNFIERLTFQGDYNARARLLPDGKHLVFVHRRNGVFHIAWQDLERDVMQVLTKTALDESPSLAPNGTMLIYATQDQGKGILAVVSIDGRVKYRLPSSSGDVREPAWSPFINTLSEG